MNRTGTEKRAMILQRAFDGYVNATAMCQAAGKLFSDYGRLAVTQAFLTELSTVMGIPITELVVVKRGGVAAEQGTWVHPDVAVNLGQWCSPKFAVAVSRWVHDGHFGDIHDLIAAIFSNISLKWDLQNSIHLPALPGFFSHSW